MDQSPTSPPHPCNPTRAEGLKRLADFLPRAGWLYAEDRNHDRGPANRSNVSTLSPYIRHRLITEQEVVAAALQRHGPKAAAKFIQEVAWRTYWKGWLELRPAVWRSYRQALANRLAEVNSRQSLHDQLESAIHAQTGIDCFDSWVIELKTENYLHNHARMWFASIWIFTLGLPWELGADLFMQHLLDGDPASNTLSWRWVAGLQTRGKTYQATAENIARYTGGRFRPARGLAENACPVHDVNPTPPAGRLAPPEKPSAEPSVLLLTEDDLKPDDLPLGHAQVIAVAGLLSSHKRSPAGVADPVLSFTTGALRNGIDHASRSLGVEPGPISFHATNAEVADWVRRLGARQVLTPWAPVGPAADRLASLDPVLAESGLRLVRLRRPWDEELWPQATAGYFPFKERLPEALQRLGLGPN